MRLIISPAKKMNTDPDSLPWKALPAFLPQAQRLCAILQGMTPEELKKLWKCNDRIAAQNVERLQNMDLRHNLTPAILAYEGIQYQYMAPAVFTDTEYDYIDRHLRILSGFYGILKPFDGITPYRLEMQAMLSVDGSKNLYDFWGSQLAEQLAAETDCVVNLASKEYSSAVSAHLSPSVQMITCVFGELRNGKVIEKGTLCKMARGEMVRWLAEQQITDPERMKGFDRLQYRYSEPLSQPDKYVFILQQAAD